MYGDQAIARIGGSTMKPADKSFFTRIVDSLGTTRDRFSGLSSRATVHLESGATAVRQVAEGGATAIALSAVDVYQANGGLDIKSKYPLDAGLALLGIGGSIWLADHAAAPTLRSVGNAAANIFLFRKGHSYFTKAHAEKGGVPSGSMASPIPATSAAAGGAVAPHGDDPNSELARLAASL